MIHINLLPPELVPKRRNIVPYVLVVFLAAGLTLALLNSYWGVQRERARLETERDRVQAELDSYAATVEKVELLMAQQDRLALKEEAIREITAGRTAWSHELYELSWLVPEEIWLQEMTIGERRRSVMVEKPNPNRQPGAPPTITVAEIRSFPALVFTGYALSPYREEGVRLVGQFISHIKQDPEFATRFVDPEMRTIERKDFEGKTVMQFVMDVEIRG